MQLEPFTGAHVVSRPAVTIKLLLVLSLLRPATPACPNQCSGHGECTSENVCQCDDSWSYNADCSGRGMSRASFALFISILAEMRSM